LTDVLHIVAVILLFVFAVHIVKTETRKANLRGCLLDAHNYYVDELHKGVVDSNGMITNTRARVEALNASKTLMETECNIKYGK
jgi:hypothetical protein